MKMEKAWLQIVPDRVEERHGGLVLKSISPESKLGVDRVVHCEDQLCQ